VELSKKHQERIKSVHRSLSWLCDAAQDAFDVLSKLAPEKLPKPRELSDEDWDQIFGSE
jgi:hypothetical protein